MKVFEGLPMEKYLAMPAVSASILKAMVDECPRAAWWQSHLNPALVRETSDEMDLGTLCHSMLLEDGPGKVLVIKPEDYPAKNGNVPVGWTNGAIREARDEARANGFIPVLPGDMLAANAIVASAKGFIESLRKTEPAVWQAFQPGGGDSELTVTWNEGEAGCVVPCRIRSDRTSADRRLIVDLKFTGMSANPFAWKTDYTGAAFYRRGFGVAFDTQPEYLFLVTETNPPYLSSLVGVSPAGFEFGTAKAMTGLLMWQRCMESGIWPGYPTMASYQDVPVWQESQWIERGAMGMEHYEKLWGGLK